jgi:N-acetylglucosamine-6-sulfatase
MKCGLGVGELTRLARTSFVAALAVGGTALSLSLPPGLGNQSTAAPQTEAPNIVLIVTDDMRSADLRAMPHVRHLLQDRGTTFQNSVAPMPLCCPSRASLLTGQYPHNHKVLGNADRWHPDGGYFDFKSAGNTVATWLDSSGYQTAFVGKYLNGYGEPGTPRANPPGWDDWHALYGGSYRKVHAIENGKRRTYEDTYRTTLTTSKALSIIDRRILRANPLMLFVWHYAPHNGRPFEADDPINRLHLAVDTPVPAPFDHNWYRGTPVPKGPGFNEANISDKPAKYASDPLLTHREIAALTEQYQQRLEALRSVDRGVRDIVGAFRRAGELDDTLIVFTSDNGMMLGEHRMIEQKAIPYEPSLRVPLIIRGPNVPHGVIRTQLAGTIDIAPTLAGAARTDPGRVVDGVPLLPMTLDAALYERRDMTIQMCPGRIDGPLQWVGLRTTRYVYVQHNQGAKECYDLNRDPFELHNIIGSKHPRPALVDRLDTQLQAVVDCRGVDCQVATPE